MRQRLFHLTRQPAFIIRVVLLILSFGVGAAFFVQRTPLKKAAASQKPHLPFAPKVGDPGIPNHDPDADPDSDGDGDSDQDSDSDLDDMAEHLGFTPLPLSPDATERQLLEWIQAKAAGKEFEHIKLPESIREVTKDIVADATKDLSHITLTEHLKQAKYPEERKSLFSTYADALWLKDKPRFNAQSSLESIAHAEPQVPLASEMAGDVWRSRNDVAQALKAYIREGRLDDSVAARQKAILICATQKDRETLLSLSSNPAYQAAIHDLELDEQRQVALVLGDLKTLVKVTGQATWEEIVTSPLQVLLTLVCGAIWFIILHQIGGVSVRRGWRGLLAVGLGLLSPVLTLVLLSLQEHYNGLTQQGEILNDLVFFVSGVGLREELSKLIFFAPLLFVLRGRSDAEVLIVAGCVGLGFAIGENISYFSGFAITNTLSRLVSANFMHIATTGLTGLALFHWIRFPRSFWERSLLTIVGMVVLHGLYDFCISPVAGLERYALGRFSFIILLVLGQYYLTELRRVRLARGNTIGPLFAFLSGIALLASCTLVVGSMTLGLEPALSMLFASGLGSAMLIIMFSYHLREF